MNELEQYYKIADNIYMLFTVSVTAYCYALLVKPFLADQSSVRLQKRRAQVTAAVYICMMLFLHYMPYYINVMLAYGVGISVTFLVMCLLDPVCISQKLFLSVTFFSLRWQAALSEKIGYDMLILIYAIFCYATTLTIIWLFRQWKNEHEEDKQREIFSRQMQDLEAHITETERLYRDMRTLRHDMGNHLMTLKHLYAQGESGAAEAYAAALQEQTQTAPFGIASGNPVTDVILSDREKEMEEKSIAFSCDFHYPADNEINAFDISIILNNGLSNAIEAIERENSPAPRIFLSSYRMKNMYVIEIANSYTGKLTRIRSAVYCG